MPEPSNNRQLTLLSVSILLAAVLISGSVLLTRSTQSLDRLTRTSQMPEAGLGAMEQRQPAINQPSSPSGSVPTTAPAQRPSSQPVATTASTTKTFTWKEFEMSYPANLVLERTQTGWQLNGSRTANISIVCPAPNSSQYSLFNLTLKADRGYDRTNNHAWDARLLEGTDKNQYDGEPERRMYLIQGAWDQSLQGKEGCDVTLLTDTSRSQNAFTDTYQLAQSLYQSIK